MGATATLRVVTDQNPLSLEVKTEQDRVVLSVDILAGKF
jgi:hypothetical protein